MSLFPTGIEREIHEKVDQALPFVRPGCIVLSIWEGNYVAVTEFTMYSSADWLLVH